MYGGVCARVCMRERERNGTPLCIREHKTKGIYFLFFLMFWSFSKTESSVGFYPILALTVLSLKL